jgi:hypothetical protein
MFLALQGKNGPPEALGEAEAPAAGPSAARRAAGYAAAKPLWSRHPDDQKPAGGYFSLAFHCRLANMGEENFPAAFHFNQGGEEEKWAGNR